MKAIGLLKRAVEVAQGVERELEAIAKPTGPQAVALGCLVRSRRFGQALEHIPESHAYEGLALFRCMVETQINLKWMRADMQARSKRFTAFEPLERLQLIQEIPEFIPEGERKAIVERLKAQREKLEKVFGSPAKGGGTRWAKHWAEVESLRDRLEEVRKAEGARRVPFIYVLYRWASSVIHGGPISIASVIRRHDDGRFRPIAQPLEKATSVYAGAGVSLAATIGDAAAIGGISPGQGLAALMAEFRKLASEGDAGL